MGLLELSESVTRTSVSRGSATGSLHSKRVIRHGAPRRLVTSPDAARLLRHPPLPWLAGTAPRQYALGEWRALARRPEASTLRYAARL